MIGLVLHITHFSILQKLFDNHQSICMEPFSWLAQLEEKHLTIVTDELPVIIA